MRDLLCQSVFVKVFIVPLLFVERVSITSEYFNADVTFNSHSPKVV